jgi:esterase/lipase
MQKFKAKTLEGMIEELKEQKVSTQRGTMTMLLFDENDNLVDAFKHTQNILTEVRDALKEVAFYFHCMHIMTRMTLCGGM